MDLATQLSGHLRAVGGDPDPDGERHMRDVAAGLAAIARDVADAVPSCLSVSILLGRPFGDIVVSLPVATPVRHGPVVVRASLAIPLDAPLAESLLLLQAQDSGAFVLLADDLAAQRDDEPPLLVDQHLGMLIDPGAGSLSADLADLRAVEQAVGAMIEQGWLPAQARRALHERARAARLPAARLARQMLAALPVPRPNRDDPP